MAVAVGEGKRALIAASMVASISTVAVGNGVGVYGTVVGIGIGVADGTEVGTGIGIGNASTVAATAPQP